MSVVTTLIITTSCAESHEDAAGADVYPSINFINDEFGVEWLKPVHDFAGGNKYPQAYVFMAAINHLDFNQLLSYMRAAPWEMPEAVGLLVSFEEDDGFRQIDWRKPYKVCDG